MISMYRYDMLLLLCLAFLCFAFCYTGIVSCEVVHHVQSYKKRKEAVFLARMDVKKILYN
jgi:hypothetical protein